MNRRSPVRVGLACLALLIGSPVCAQPAASAEAIAQAVGGSRIVLLGEVHDNAEQHALRLATLKQMIAAGKRPAIAFEQFDQERQADIDRARRERPGDADHLIASAAGRSSWRWEFYRPFIEIALANDLPIVAANLSRASAIKVAREGWKAVFDVQDRAALGLDQLPAELLTAHEEEIAQGHCGLLAPTELQALARAQIARDIVLARALAPYQQSGVVLLAGNGHVRKDIGVPLWLSAADRMQTLSVGLIESESEPSPSEWKQRYDHAWLTSTSPRADRCEQLRKRRADAVAK